MRIVYAVFIRDIEIRRWISALRLLCDPEQKYPAHITVRGPYAAPLPPNDLHYLDTVIEGARVRVYEAGCFFGASQSTVFLSCASSAIEKIWSKPRLDYLPHITLYDGKSRLFADALLEILNRYRIFFEFRVTGLQALRLSSGQSTIELASEFAADAVSAILGRHVDAMSVKKLTESQRLDAVGQLCDYLFGDRVTDWGRDSRVPLASGWGDHKAP